MNKGLHHEICAKFHGLLGGDQVKKKVFVVKSEKKPVLAQEFWGNNQFLRVFVTFFGAQSSLGRHNSCFGGHKQ